MGWSAIRKCRPFALAFSLLACVTASGQTDNVLHEIANLKDAQPGIRSNAAHTLGEMHDSRAVMPLVLALKDPKDEVRVAAVLALGQLKDAQSIEPLVSALHDANEEAKTYAALALGEFKDSRAVAALIALLNESDQESEGAAASSLGRIGVFALGPLAENLKNPNPAVRRRAAVALGWIDDSRSVDALIFALKDPNAGVRAAVVTGLKGHRDAPGLLLAPFDFWESAGRIRMNWVAGVARDPRVIDLLIGALQDPGAEVRSAAVEALGEIEAAHAAEPLIALLHMRVTGAETKAAQDEIRWKTVEALGRIGDKRAVDPLKIALQSPDERIRVKAAEALGQIKDANATDTLTTALARDESVTVRMSAARALGDIKDARAIEPLIAALKDSNFQISNNAAQALGKMADPRAIEPLLAAMKSRKVGSGVPVAVVEREVIAALGQIGAPAVDALITTAQSSDDTVRLGAIDALSGIKDPRIVAPLARALDDEKAEIRAAAAKGLGWSQSPAAAQPVLKALKDQSEEVRNNAVQGLCWNNSSWVIEPLIAAMRDSESRFAAQCLNSPTQEIQAPIKEPFVALLNDPDSHVRELAARALSEPIPLHLMLRGSEDASDVRVIDALREALKKGDTAAIWGAFTFFIALGDPNSEDALIQALNDHGEKWSAGYLVTCGNAKIEEAARAWLKERNLKPDEHILGPVWGTLHTTGQLSGMN